MFFMEFLFALVIALLVGSIFSAAGRPGPWPGVWWFFLMLFLFTWAIGAWTVPFGPVLWGVHWVPYLLFAVLAALLMAAAAQPRTPPRTAREAQERAREATAVEAAATVALSIFFWMAIIGLVAALAARYI